MSDETLRCAPGCTGIDLGDGNTSGCSCPDGKLANGSPQPHGFACDCPKHPGPDADFAALLDDLQNAVHDYETAPKRGESQNAAHVVIGHKRAAVEAAIRASRSSSGTPDVRMFPLQSESLRRYTKPQLTQIPWSVAEKAYGTYAARYGRDQSLERLAERGGFGQSEMDVLHPTWREEASEIAALRAEIDRLHSLAPSSGTGDARPSKVTCEHGVDTLTTCDACLSAMMERAGWKRASPSSGTALAPWYEGDGSTVMLPAAEVERRRKLAAKVLEVARRVVRDLYYADGPGGALLNELRARFSALDAASPPPPTPGAKP
jgi:hypothetical protein